MDWNAKMSRYNMQVYVNPSVTSSFRSLLLSAHLLPFKTVSTCAALIMTLVLAVVLLPYTRLVVSRLTFTVENTVRK
jgi:hypothetical protein